MKSWGHSAIGLGHKTVLAFSLILGSVAFSCPTCGAADKTDLVLTRQELRHQVYLYNDWIEDVLHSTWTPNETTLDRLPPERVFPNLIGQLKEATFSADDLAARRERLTRWIGLLATSRRFSGDMPST